MAEIIYDVLMYRSAMVSHNDGIEEVMVWDSYGNLYHSDISDAWIPCPLL